MLVLGSKEMNHCKENIVVTVSLLLSLSVVICYFAIILQTIVVEVKKTFILEIIVVGLSETEIWINVEYRIF